VDANSPYKANATVTVLGGETLAKPRWVFTGWNTEQNGQGTFYEAGKTFTITSDTDLYGIWQEYCTVTYHANFPEGMGTGTAPVDTSSPYKRDATVTVLGGAMLAKSGWEFLGWHTDQNSPSALYEAGKTFIITVDTNLYGIWKKLPTPNNRQPVEKIEEEIPVTSPFIDDHVAYIIGYPDGNVRPERNVSRAEVATVFFRLLTDEMRANNWTRENPFPDVSAGIWYNNAISVMYKMGILAGYPDGMFRPNGAITRAELAAIAARFARMMEMLSRNDRGFIDIGGHWAEGDIRYAAAIGWVNGYPDDTFMPNQNITRAEFMTLVNRMLERAPETVDDLLADEMIIWPDNKPGAWSYLAVQEATNSHTCTFKQGKIVPGLNFEYESWEGMEENRDWSQLEKGLLTSEQVKAQFPTPVNMAISTWQPEKQLQSRNTGLAFSNVSGSYWAYKYDTFAKNVLSQ
jgi:hypothetical protein